ncbi:MULTISPECIES: ATP-dependent protease ATPase subunit HslU [Thermoactinomyces]|uniref:ATP-dependent protease ATPase subunit HslU n=1 Tax=Thermoactinomyces daqus TaxID=1329516 RepID=A0A7W2AJR1_9BACL|nr:MULTISPECIES: ATP-dependent protease ATPase subunit HslU [Thermoactinomyces]MBA4544064.1 ATP-dependent protease ATPase subunit HslU [Thermoactinomyces daqus]MBH8603252.1 ATP-dependent protease ATPase subunit HslU [Thermoactinomyces sp. CICC 10522]MBH8608592.1 ATP-dependent protease ATPase subunit HslU [Thermoactinomyces sp. CICC 10521]
MPELSPQAKWTPRQIVAELDKYIVGQTQAKRAVAIALRNRYRRMLLPEELRDEVVPKNILMIGPTGVGKTEIARRLAKLVGAPFVKLEATKFTEVGYVGRDVESMVRDLVETGIRMVKAEKLESVKDEARAMANDRIVSILVPDQKESPAFKNPFEFLFQQKSEGTPGPQEQQEKRRIREERALVKEKLLRGELEEQMIEIEVEEQMPSMFDMFAGTGVEQMGMNMQEMLGQLMPKRTKRRRLTVKEAREVLTQQEGQKLIDMDHVIGEALSRVEQSGIIFLDEIDKIAGKDQRGPDVSREGVQRDILPIVEGSTVITKYGPVKTDHILFIAAGAFHVSKPSDLIPELQGRFPIRVELDDLSADDFVRILTEPKGALIKQYIALLETEGIKITFTKEAVEEIARLAQEVNSSTENIGARRLHTILERLLEELSFEAPEIGMGEITITPQYVQERLADVVTDRDLSQYIL